MPATTAFIDLLFGESGAWRYLSDYLRPGAEAYSLKTRDMPLATDAVRAIALGEDLEVQSIGVHHGPIASVAWRIEAAGCSLVFAGDTSNRSGSLQRIARGADVLVAHNPVPESARGAAVNLHMRPSAIGRVASEAGVGQLILSHRMTRSLGREAETLAQIRRHYAGPVSFAETGQRFHYQLVIE
jgi:ribonuclease BN (tRNA processing enzyme)